MAVPVPTGAAAVSASPPTVTAAEAVVPAPPAPTSGAGDIEVVQPRRPRPHSPFPVTRTRGNRPPSREPSLPDEMNAVAETLAGQTQANANPDASANPEAIVNRAAGADPAPLPSAAGETRAATLAAADAEELFAPRQTDRSPESWVARLTGRTPVAQQPPSSSPLSSPLLAAPEPFPANATATPPPIEIPGRRMVPVPPASPVHTAIAPPPVVDASAEAPVPAVTSTSARPIAAPDLPEPSAPVAPVAPTPLPDSTRRFLQPLVGIDPASVQVYSDPAATQFVARANADALAVGDVVALGTGQLPGAGTPETLGLLAHELTHVARSREHRFIPPIARATGQQARAGGESVPPTDEEALARTVEARVMRAAEADQNAERQSLPLAFAAPRRAVPPPVAAWEPADITPADLADEASVPTGDAQGPAAASADTPRVAAAWNGLPTPWEPLPNWLATPAPSAYSAPPLPAPSPTASGVAAPGATAPAVQLAEHGRAVDEAAPTGAAAPSEQHAARPPEPDLDALARQVYAVLRRRLAVEGRRAW